MFSQLRLLGLEAYFDVLYVKQAKKRMYNQLVTNPQSTIVILWGLGDHKLCVSTDRHPVFPSRTRLGMKDLLSLRLLILVAMP